MYESNSLRTATKTENEQQTFSLVINTNENLGGGETSGRKTEDPSIYSTDREYENTRVIRCYFKVVSFPGQFCFCKKERLLYEATL